MTSIRFPALLILLAISPVANGDSHRHSQDPARFRVDSALVLVPVTVTDRRGASIVGLGREAFSVFEDHAERPIVSFHEQDERTSVGMVLDLSGSMKDNLSRAKSTLVAFLREAEPDDEALLMGVSDRPIVLRGFSKDAGRLVQSAVSAKSGGSTALVDTIYLGLHHLRKGRNSRKALLVVSDGIDNHSQYTTRELLNAAVEADVQIYTVAINEVPRYRKPIEMQESARGLAFLSELSSKTGGHQYVVQSGKEIAEAVGRIQHALKNQYVLGYHPASPDNDGKWHTIHVKLELPEAHVTARPGYYSR